MFISKVNQLAEKLTKEPEVPATGTLRPDLEDEQHPCNAESHTQGAAQALLERSLKCEKVSGFLELRVLRTASLRKEICSIFPGACDVWHWIKVFH